MKKPEMPCPMHDEHLCYLVNMGYVENSLNDYKKLVKDAKFVCKKCGGPQIQMKTSAGP